jgi:parvulin-like peptidyl-prolyl isomerase
MFKLQQIQMQNVVTMDAGARQRMLEQGKKMGVSLTPEETSKLLAVARQNKDPNGEEFKKFLKDRNITPQDFDKQVKEIGLAIKTANVILQQTLLNDLVNRELLVAAAKSAGFSPKAESRYLEIKHSDTFDKLQKATGFTAEQLRDELIKTELTKMMVARIQQRAQISDADVKEFYNQHKEMFKHPERIRLSQILVGAPAQDFGNVQSVKTQLQKANPNLSKSELDAQVAAVIQRQTQAAEGLLLKAKSGSDFKEIANQYTDDVAAKTAKSGGDLGWQTKQQLLPQLADAVWPLKVGEVYPRLVRSNLGFHIFKVTGHEQPGTVSLNESKANIRAALLQQKAERTLGEWIQDKRMTSKIALSPAFSEIMQKSSAGKTSALPAATN